MSALNLGDLEFYGPLASGVALHGLVDCISKSRLLCYIPALVPFEGAWLSGVFVTASLVHFSADVSVLVSVLIHSMIAMFALLDAREGATAILLGYMWIVHMPLMLFRAFVAGQYLAFAVILLSISAGAYGGTSLLTRLHLIDHQNEEKTTQLVLPPMAQRLVICHVVANLFAP